MGSKRFPGKMMSTLAGRPLLEWVLLRAKRSRLIDELVLATSSATENDLLERTANQLGVSVVRGDEDDVLGRFVLAARTSGAEMIVRICADNPFVAPEEIDRVVEYYLENQPDYAFNHLPRRGNGYPDGFGAEVLSRALLEEIDRLTTEPRHREHVTLYVWDHAERYVIGGPIAPATIAGLEIKLDVDTVEDLEWLASLCPPIAPESSAVEIVQVYTDRIGARRAALRL
jgi:spore coat polysaccharide biosynthesis protein SpsF